MAGTDREPLLRNEPRESYLLVGDASNNTGADTLLPGLPPSAPGQSGINPLFIGMAVITVIGGTFQFGYNTGVINQPADTIREALAPHGHATMPTFLWSLVVSAFAIGGLIGGLCAGKVVDEYGRRNSLIANNVVFLGSAATMALAPSAAVLIVGRLGVGIASGATTVIVPMYLSEISPAAFRGAIGTANQFAITSGILVSQVLGSDKILGTSSGWRYLLGLTAGPAVIQLCTLCLFPKSPRWLYMTKRLDEQAFASLAKIRRSRTLARAEIALMDEERQKQKGRVALNALDVLQSAKLRLPLVIGIGLQACQQLSGINAIFYFSTDIFKKANVSDTSLATQMVGVLNVVMTAVVMYLMDRAGRRRLMLVGMGGMAISYGVLTVSYNFQSSAQWLSYVTIAAVLAVVFFFAIGPGAIAWLMVAEIFPAHASGGAVSLCVGFNWLFNFVVGISFPSVQSLLGKQTFIPFCALNGLFFCFILLVVPETKNKTIDEITSLLAKRKGFMR